MWPVLTRRPSLLAQLLQTLRALLAAQQETNLLLRELLMQHGKSPSTPQATIPFTVTAMQIADAKSRMPNWMPPSPTPSNAHPQQSDRRKRTKNDVSTSWEANLPQPMSQDATSAAPEPPDA